MACSSALCFVEREPIYNCILLNEGVRISDVPQSAKKTLERNLSTLLLGRGCSLLPPFSSTRYCVFFPAQLHGSSEGFTLLDGVAQGWCWQRLGLAFMFCCCAVHGSIEAAYVVAELCILRLEGAYGFYDRQGMPVILSGVSPYPLMRACCYMGLTT